MNREIAQYCMKANSQYHNEMCEECPIYGQTGDDHCFEDALQYVINHFDVFDKIRAEIKSKIVKRPWLDFEDMERDRNDAFLETLDIIDKYKNEVNHDI